MTKTAEARATWLHHIAGWAFVIDTPDRLGVAVSGGGDSMALLDLMIWHGTARGFSVEAVTVDHGLRPESADEAEFVAKHCAARGVPHSILRWDGWDGTGNLPARARGARYAMIAGWAQERGIAKIALGHTRQDVAEGFLLRLARGAGVDGLAAMKRHFDLHGLTWLRPLIQCDRDHLREYLRDRHLDWREDPTNDDPAYDRTRARQILTALKPLGIDADRIATAASNLASARWTLDHYTWAEAPKVVTQDRGDLILRQNVMPPVPPEIHRRLLTKALQWVSGAPYSPRQSAMINLDVALNDSDRHTVSGCLVTRHVTARRRDETLRITREWNAVKSLETGTGDVWDGRWRLDGPHAADLRIRALGSALSECPDWRATGLPRTTLLASPAIWRDDTIIAAPLAGLSRGWTAFLADPRQDFHASLL